MLPRKIETVALRYAWIIVAIDLAGTVFGFWYYIPQFRLEPVLAWSVVPNSPTATSFIACSLALYKLAPPIEYLNMLALIGCIKLGLWTPYVLTVYCQRRQITHERLCLNARKGGCLSASAPIRMLEWKALGRLAPARPDILVLFHRHVSMPGMGGDDLAESALDAVSSGLAILVGFGSWSARSIPAPLRGRPRGGGHRGDRPRSAFRCRLMR